MCWIVRKGALRAAGRSWTIRVNLPSNFAKSAVTVCVFPPAERGEALSFSVMPLAWRSQDRWHPRWIPPLPSARWDDTIPLRHTTPFRHATGLAQPRSVASKDSPPRCYARWDDAIPLRHTTPFRHATGLAQPRSVASKDSPPAATHGGMTQYPSVMPHPSVMPLAWRSQDRWHPWIPPLLRTVG